jgi:excinuclease ABC subunit C
LEKASSVKTSLVGSEVEALLLEADLIKRLKPPYNVRFKDDRGYQFIRMTREEYPKLEKVSQPLAGGEIPRSARDKHDWRSGTAGSGPANLFGPYPLGNVVLILKALRKVFPFRDCSLAKFQRYQRLKRPCLYGELRLCPAPCVGQIKAVDYQQHVKNIVELLKGRKKKVLRQLKRKMQAAAKNQDFEKAAFWRNQWQKLSFLEPTPYPPEMEDSLLKISPTNVLGKKTRAEAYDISHLTGKEAVGAMVVFTNHTPEKNAYRRFRIRGQKTLDDYAMLQEVLHRRLTNQQLGPLPDLILIDGGPGQLTAAIQVQKKLGLRIPTCALAKRKEEIYTQSTQRLDFLARHSGHAQNLILEPPRMTRPKITRLVLPSTSPLLHFFQRLRDEAHRFALSYHHRLRKRIAVS